MNKDNGKKSDPRIIKRTCKNCGHKKMWEQRGYYNPVYTFKCSKCGFKEGGMYDK